MSQNVFSLQRCSRQPWRFLFRVQRASTWSVHFFFFNKHWAFTACKCAGNQNKANGPCETLACVHLKNVSRLYRNKPTILGNTIRRRAPMNRNPHPNLSTPSEILLQWWSLSCNHLLSGLLSDLIWFFCSNKCTKGGKLQTQQWLCVGQRPLRGTHPDQPRWVLLLQSKQD